MTSKTTTKDTPKTPIENFEEEVKQNREANRFRQATKELLVDSKQIVVTLTLNPSSKQLMITGESSIINNIAKKGIEVSTIDDIKTLMLKNNEKKNTNFVFSELYQNDLKNYKTNESVYRLPELNHVNHETWGSKDGRKVVGSYMADIKARNNNKYDKNKEKLAPWLPVGFKKVYNANMTRDDTTQVMKAILKHFPEVNPKQKVVPPKEESKSEVVCSKRRAQQNKSSALYPTISDSSDDEENDSSKTLILPSKRPNQIYPTLFDSSDEDEPNCEPSLRDFNFQMNKQKPKSTVKREARALADPTDEEPQFSHSTPKKFIRKSKTQETNLDLNYSSAKAGKCTSKHTKEDSNCSNISRQILVPTRATRASTYKRSYNEKRFDENPVVKTVSRSQKLQQTTKPAQKVTIDQASSKEKLERNASKRKEQHQRCSKINTGRNKVTVEFQDDEGSQISDLTVNDTVELEENTYESRVKKNARYSLRSKSETECKRETENLKKRAQGSTRSRPKMPTGESSSETTKRISEKAGCGMHSDLRQKLFFGKTMHLMPREGWQSWVKKLARKPCKCCPENSPHCTNTRKRTGEK